MSCLPLGECSRQLTTGAYENAQLSRGKNSHEGAASSLCAMHNPHMPASAHGMYMCVMWGYVCVCWGQFACAHIPLYNTLRMKVFMNSVCACACVYVCLYFIFESVAYLIALIVPFQVCVCVCLCVCLCVRERQKEDKGQAGKARSHKDSTIRLMLLS